MERDFNHCNMIRTGRISFTLSGSMWLWEEMNNSNRHKHGGYYL